MEHLASGGHLLVALDALTGRQVEVPVGTAGETFQLSTGAMRLAARYGATLMSCNVVSKGHWRFRVELGRPVPTGLLTGEPDLTAVGKHLLGDMLPCWRLHPEQCSAALLRCFRRSQAR